MNIQSLQDIKAAVALARRAAIREGAQAMPYIKSRGTYLTTANRDGQCSPCERAQCADWKGTKRDIETLVARVLAGYPECTEIAIEGGYDGYDSFRDMLNDGDYEPWVSEWEVVVWRRFPEPTAQESAAAGPFPLAVHRT